jgi:hypothetical protein
MEADLTSPASKNKDGSYDLGVTTTKSNVATDAFTGKVEEVQIVSADIKINVANIEAVMKGLDAGTIKNDNLKGLNFDEMLAVTVGHEIDHTTKDNVKDSAEGKDKEAGPTATGYQIAKELKELKKN